MNDEVLARENKVVKGADDVSDVVVLPLILVVGIFLPQTMMLKGKALGKLMLAYNDSIQFNHENVCMNLFHCGHLINIY